MIFRQRNILCVCQTNIDITQLFNEIGEISTIWKHLGQQKIFDFLNHIDLRWLILTYNFIKMLSKNYMNKFYIFYNLFKLCRFFRFFCSKVVFWGSRRWWLILKISDNIKFELFRIKIKAIRRSLLK